MKILIAGGTGMLGSECGTVFSRDHHVVTPGMNEMDITNWDGVIETLQKLSPGVVINAAGFNDVDACEADTYAVRKTNIEGPRNLAQCSARYECKLAHVSSDYVFDGQKMMPQPYFEDDAMNPLSAFGRSKRDSEIAVRENAPYYIIVRTGWLYGRNGTNFVKTVIGRALKFKGETLRVADDQVGSPTWAYRLALQMHEILANDGRGTYHATAEGYCSRFQCARRVLKKLDIKAALEPCTLKDLGRPAPRPCNCILENRFLKKQGINAMVPWEQDLDLFLDRFGDELIREAETHPDPDTANVKG